MSCMRLSIEYVLVPNKKYFSRQNQVYPVSLASKLVQHKKKQEHITNDIQNI